MTPNQKLAILLGAIAIPTAIAAWDKLRSDDAPPRYRRRHVHGSFLSLFARNSPYLPDEDDDGDHDALERYGRDQAAKQAARLAAEKAATLAAQAHADEQRRAAFDDAFGTAHPGAPGPAFRDFLDGRGEPPDGWMAFQRATGARITPDLGAHALDLDLDDGHGMRAAIERAWGPSAGDAWMDAADHVRAAMTEDAVGAHLRWRRALVVDELAIPASLDAIAVDPGAVVGGAQPTDRRYDDATASQPQRTRFTMDPLGWSDSALEIDVDFDRHDRVVAAQIHTNDPNDDAAVLARLAAQLGPAVRDDGAIRTWRSGALVVAARTAPEGVIIELTRARR